MFSKVGKHVPVVLGVLLLYSGVYKLLSPGEATLALKSLDLSIGLARWTIGLVTILELYFGVLLVAKIDLKFALVAVMALMFLFTMFLWYLSTLAHPPACGCMGLTWAFTTGKKGAVLGIARNCIILWLLKIAYDYYFRQRRGVSSTGTL